MYQALGLRIKTISRQLGTSLQHRCAIASLALGIILSGCATLQKTPTDAYKVVIDAGSSGSRAYIYKISGSNPLSIETIDEKLTGNLKSGALSKSNIKGEDVISPLLSGIKNFARDRNVPEEKVQINVLGTAGMRLLSEAEQQNIYANVRRMVMRDHFSPGRFATITGQEEGLYAWLDVNYLNNAIPLGRETTGIIEIGGASTQIAFDSPKLGPAATYTLRIGGNEYAIYSQSLLGFGMNEARMKMEKSQGSSTCYPKGYERKDGSAANEFDSQTCRTSYSALFQGTSKQEIEEILNSIRKNYSDRPFYGVSGLYYTMRFLDINTAAKRTLNEKIDTICRQDYRQLEANAQDQDKPLLPVQCANSVYVDALLFQALDIGDGLLTRANSINDSKLSWTRGYMVYQQAQSK